MRIHLLSLGALLGALICFPACKKSTSDTGPEPPAAVIRGVKVDLPKLQQSLEKSNPDAMTSITRIMMALRARNYEGAIMELDKIANDPKTTEDQKKLTLKVIDQLKEVMNKPAQ